MHITFNVAKENCWAFFAYSIEKEQQKKPKIESPTVCVRVCMCGCFGYAGVREKKHLLRCSR